MLACSDFYRYMNKRLQSLQLNQMEAALKNLRAVEFPARPAGGWARAIRESLGMSGVALAKRLGMTTAGARKLEVAEENHVITVASLRKLAAALDCELKYVLVPRKPLDQMLQERARLVATARLRPVSNSMSLEDQSVEGDARQLQIDLLAKELIDGSRRELW